MEPDRTALLPGWNSLPALSSREVQVYALHVEEDPALVRRARRLLSPAELDRAAAVRVARARDEFVVGRAALRVVLAGALDSAPDLLNVEADEFGKPFVPGIHCNVSHSRGLIYVALCRESPVGIDVEWMDPGLEALDIAEANFAHDEIGRMQSQSAGWERTRVFYQLWTRKEAVAKASGRGLRTPLRDIVVPHGPEGPAWIAVAEMASPALSGCPPEFFVQDLAAPYGFAAALALQGDALPLRFIRRLPLQAPARVR